MSLVCLGHENSNVQYNEKKKVFGYLGTESQRQRESNVQVTCAGVLSWQLGVAHTSDSSMLAVRTSSPTLHLRHSTRQSRSLFQVMAHGKTNWEPPERVTGEPVLKVYNTFTRTKVRPFRACWAPFDSFSLFQDVFTPRNGRRIKWYNCGPTVYDAAHMGHAR